MDYSGVSVMRNAIGWGNSREEKEEKKQGTPTELKTEKRVLVR